MLSAQAQAVQCKTKHTARTSAALRIQQRRGVFRTASREKSFSTPSQTELVLITLFLLEGKRRKIIFSCGSFLWDIPIILHLHSLADLFDIWHSNYYSLFIQLLMFIRLASISCQDDLTVCVPLYQCKSHTAGTQTIALDKRISYGTA